DGIRSYKLRAGATSGDYPLLGRVLRERVARRSARANVRKRFLLQRALVHHERGKPPDRVVQGPGGCVERLGEPVDPACAAFARERVNRRHQGMARPGPSGCAVDKQILEVAGWRLVPGARVEDEV